MQANSTITPTITQAPTGYPIPCSRAQRVTTQGYKNPWSDEDAVYSADRYRAWLQQMPSDRWQGLFGQHTPQDFERALGVCRYYKAAKAKYDAAGQPARWMTRLQQIQQEMRRTLQALHFATPQELWQQYLWAMVYRDPWGYSPDHAAHIAEVDHYLWLRDVTATLSIDGNDGGYTSPYPNNVDAALEATRTRPLDYAVIDDADNPAYQLATIHRQIGHASRKRKAVFARIKTTTDAQAKQKLAARYHTVAAEIKRQAAEAKELTRLLTPPMDEDGEYEISPDQWARQIAYQTADYGLQRSTPAAPDTQTVDIYNTAAEATDAIQNLLDLQRQSRDLIAYIDSRTAAGKEFTPTQERMYAEAIDLLPVITASLAAQTARLHA
jgi:hypothetical protein